ncbi:YbjN domain-containing protein [Corynebacterium phocae]|nr:YbjN domain-containing protein [Corynebacterium phocae]KAA8720576.1 YbjN domain-containing protein [Corynebacterium phocae]
MTVPEFFSIDRVAAYFDRQDYNYLTDNDGDIHINFDGISFLLLSTGQIREILAIRAQWDKKAPIEARGTLFEFINKWHSEKLFPKADLQVNDEGKLEVGCEVNTDLEHGVTDQQLELLVDCAITTSLSFFTELNNLDLPAPEEPKKSPWWR